MNHEKSTPKELDVIERKELKAKSSAWYERYQKGLSKFIEEEKIDKESFTGLVWEGILDHMAPNSEEEQNARRVFNKEVWNRDDSNLYWRILYSAGHVEHGIEKGQSTAGPVASALIPGVGNMMFSGVSDRLLTEEEVNSGKDPSILIIKKIANGIMDKSRIELEKLGEKPHKKLIPIGAKGTFKSIPVVVNHYLFNGKIELMTESREDYIKLGEVNNFRNAVEPEELNPNEFTLPT